MIGNSSITVCFVIDTSVWQLKKNVSFSDANRNVEPKTLVVSAI